MKILSLPTILLAPICLSSCGLLNTATQLPLRTLQSLGRSTGMGLEQTEVEGENAEVKFELVDDKPVKR